MKRIVCMLIIGLQSLILSAGHCSNIHDDTVIYTDGSIDISISNHERASLVDKYLRSIIPGLIVGGGVGVVSGFFDHIAPDFWVLTWLVSFWQRRDLIDDISIDMHRHDLPHNKSIMSLSSVIASWVVWYKSYEYLHGRPPL